MPVWRIIGAIAVAAGLLAAFARTTEPPPNEPLCHTDTECAKLCPQIGPDCDGGPADAPVMPPAAAAKAP